jgi:hypothetical protein
MDDKKNTSKLDQLSEEEIELAKRLEFDESILQYLKQFSCSTIQQLESFRVVETQLDEFSFRERAMPYRYKGISSYMNGRKQTKDIVRQMRSLVKAGFMPFYTQIGNRDECEIGIIITNNHYQLFDIKPTAAVNYGLTTTDIINTLRQWEQNCAFHLTFIDFDSLELRFENLPADIKRFSRQVHRFCPDIVEQGTGDLKDLKRVIRESKEL